MAKKLVFDTLAYTDRLKQEGIEFAHVHSAALAEAMAENIPIVFEFSGLTHDNDGPNSGLWRSDCL